MSNVVKFSGNWIKKESKSRPNKFYYFNTKTGESRWNIPEEIKNEAESIKTTTYQQITTNRNRVKVQNTPKSVGRVTKTVAQDRLKNFQQNLSNNKNEQKLAQSSITTAVINPIQLLKQRARELKNGESHEKTAKESNTDRELCANNNNVKRKNERVELVRPVTHAELKEKKTEKPGSANDRLNKLRNILKENMATNGRTIEKTHSNSTEEDVIMVDVAEENQNCCENVLDECEPMDWETIPEQLALQEINEIRQSVLDQSIKSVSKETILRISSELTYVSCMVLDTNIFLTNLKALQKTMTKLSRTIFNYPFACVPYIVLQELDNIKFANKPNISATATQAIKYLNTELTKSSIFRGQSALKATEYLIEIENPDDKILNYCLQLCRNTNCVVLLSNDTNLRNKAQFNDIAAYSYREFETREKDIVEMLAFYNEANMNSR